MSTSSSSVTLFYGLWVKTWSLAFVAEAHEKVQNTLLAIDLICLRRGKGELIAETQRAPKRTVVDLPAEVWEIVKQEVINKAIRDAEQAAIAHFRCFQCGEQELDEECNLSRLRDGSCKPADLVRQTQPRRSGRPGVL